MKTGVLSSQLKVCGMIQRDDGGKKKEGTGEMEKARTLTIHIYIVRLGTD